MKRIACLVLICVLLAGCAGTAPQMQRTVYAMNTVMDLQIWGKDANEAMGAVIGLIQDLEGKWSVTLGTAWSGKVDEDPLIKKALELQQRTQGSFSPRLRQVSQLWGFYNEAYRQEDFTIPSQAQITKALAQPQWDLGGILKGYAGEEAVQLLEQMQVSCALLNLGGNIQTYGTKPDGSPWQIAVQNPWGGEYLGILSIEGTVAAVTSGDYQRWYEKDGVRYHHIMDPATGMPADSGLRSVTVISKSGTAADALSTGLFVMGLEKAVQLWRTSGDFEAVFVCRDGSVFATQGVKLSGCTYEVIYNEN